MGALRHEWKLAKWESAQGHSRHGEQHVCGLSQLSCVTWLEGAWGGGSESLRTWEVGKTGGHH